jgi:hypothetical protein
MFLIRCFRVSGAAGRCSTLADRDSYDRSDVVAVADWEDAGKTLPRAGKHAMDRRSCVAGKLEGGGEEGSRRQRCARP